jgi:diguanylate cyclase (GGDEF)-like protein
MSVAKERPEFDERFRLELERARRGTGRLCLVLLGLDRDRIGHAPPADALDRLGAVLIVVKRQIDAAARIGGDEFGLLLPESDTQGALTLCDRVRTRLLEAHGDDDMSLTVSFGVASFPLDGATAPELLAAADRALHEAKRLGGNRTVTHAEILDASRT